MSLKIYLLRHGETEYSQRGAYCGALDAELTTEGHQMAQAFADAYCSIPWTDVYVSPMKRAITTAKPLCDILGLTMQVRDGLREISYGEWEDRELEYVRLHHEQDYIRCIATCVIGFANGMPPIMAVELGRRGMSSELRPNADEMETLLKSVGSGRAAA